MIFSVINLLSYHRNILFSIHKKAPFIFIILF
uniref:Uncharacterized protein n=1 Tax=Siphoviridae sp. ctHip2 TaxID=2827830 RepID=A0A8S5RVK5_9CAUD|nr:MAG TPA: hypothetical protein [Siphoviridae sp. ctHip2]